MVYGRDGKPRTLSVQEKLVEQRKIIRKANEEILNLNEKIKKLRESLEIAKKKNEEFDLKNKMLTKENNVYREKISEIFEILKIVR